MTAAVAETEDEQATEAGTFVDTEEDAPEEKPESEALVKDDGSPYTKADLQAQQELIRKLRKDVREARSGKNKEDQGDGEDPAKVAEQAADQKWKPLIVKTHARLLFTEAGIQAEGGAMDKVLRMLDLDDLEVGEDGQVDGLRDQVEEIRSDFPQLFVQAKQRAPRADVANKGNGVPGKNLSAAEKLVAQLRGQ